MFCILLFGGLRTGLLFRGFLLCLCCLLVCVLLCCFVLFEGLGEVHFVRCLCFVVLNEYSWILGFLVFWVFV